jgi:hypothetical protein
LIDLLSRNVDKIAGPDAGFTGNEEASRLCLKDGDSQNVANAYGRFTIVPPGTEAKEMPVALVIAFEAARTTGLTGIKT